MERLKKFVNLPLNYHLLTGLLIRLALIFYADFHDANFDVPYTDVDYKVFTDAARHVIHQESPYKRHTYRYSPIIAYILTPNIFLYKNFGKILFSIYDILVGMAIKITVEYQLGKGAESSIKTASLCALLWIYNPMSIAISTRGNADSVPCFFTILAIMFLQTDIVKGLKRFFISGVMLGVAIHLRLYPLAFSFPMYLSLGVYNITRESNLIDGIISLFPNRRQLMLMIGCIGTLYLLTHVMYNLYKYEFLFETYIYHLFRKDTRHNFSVLFYYSYLTMADGYELDSVKRMLQFFELIILFVTSLAFGCEPKTVPLALFCQAVVLVAYNSVMTSQYFIWFLSLLPLVVHNFRLHLRQASTLAMVWAVSQAAWLFHAYLLEFKSYDVFILIWLQSVLLFSSHVFILGQLIKSFSLKHSFGEVIDVAKKVKIN